MCKMIRFAFAAILCFVFLGQAAAQQIELTCRTMLIGDRPSNKPVFTPEIDTSKRTIVWTAGGTIGKRKTNLIIEDTQYSWFFDCDNSVSMCFKDNGRINRLTGQVDYMHVFPPDKVKWTTYDGECAKGIDKLF